MSRWDPRKEVGTGQSFTDWMGEQASHVGGAWGQGDYGYALGSAAMLPFELFSKGVGYVTGGPVMGGLEAIQGRQTDPFSWEEAQERYETLPGWARMGIETGVALVGPGKVGALGKLAGWEKGMKASRQLAQAQSAWSPQMASRLKDVGVDVGRAAQEAGHIGKQLPGPPGMAERAVTSRPLEIAGKVAAPLIHFGAPAYAGYETFTADTGEERGTLERLVTAGGAAFATGLVGKGVTSMASRAKARMAPYRPVNLDTSAMPQHVRQDLEHLGRSQAILKGFEPVSPNAPLSPQWPGAGKRVSGPLGWALWNTVGRVSPGLADQRGVDLLVAKMFDRYQPFRTMQAMTTAEMKDVKLEYLAQQTARKAGKDWKKMTEEDQTRALWNEWGGLSDENKIKISRLPASQDFIQLATEFFGRAPAVGVFMKPMGTALKANGVDVRNPGMVELFERYMTLKTVRQRVEKGIDTDIWKAADPKDRSYSLMRLDDDLRILGDEVEKMFPGAGGKARPAMWDDALDSVTDSFNLQLDRMVNAGLVTADDAVRMKSRGFYTRASDVRDEVGHFPHMVKDDAVLTGWFGSQPKGSPSLVAGTTAMGKTHPSTGDFGVDLSLMMEHFVWREGMIQKAKMGRALAGWANRPGVWATNMRRVAPDETTPRKGYGIVPVIGKRLTKDPKTGKAVEAVEVQKYELPEDLYNILKGMDVENADLATRFMGKAGEAFRVGVTAASIPFMFRNIGRDLERVLLLNGVSSMDFKTYWLSMYDQLTKGRVRELAKVMDDAASGKLGAAVKAIGDPVGRAERAMLSPTTGAGGKQMTWREEMMSHGAGMGTLAEVLRMRGKASAAELAGLEGGLVVTNPIELVRSISEVLELTTREMVYIVKRKADIAARTAGKKITEGQSISESVRLARECTVDFSRAGDATKILNLWAPLLNARVQGTYQGLEGMSRDPGGVMLRAMLTIAIPTLAAYNYNRENYPDLYDKIPANTKDTYTPVIIGSYTDRNEEVRPLYLTIPKDELHRIVATPLEYLMDLVYHTEAQGKGLETGQRTERDTLKMVRDVVAGISPINLDASDLGDENGWMWAVGKGVIAANPLVGTFTQLVANQDWQRGSIPISDPYAAYRDTRESVDPGDSALAAAIARGLGLTGVMRPAPSQVAFMARGMGGTAAQMFMGAGDVLAERLGIAPLQPTDYSKLQIPPGVDAEKYERIVEQMSRMDSRPWWVKALPMFFGASGGAQTQAAKIQQASGKQQKQYEDTRDMWAAVEKWQYVEYLPMEQQIQSRLQYDPSMTHGAASNQLFDLMKKRVGTIESAKLQYPLAIVDPRDRKAFHESLPGVPVKLADQVTYLQEIEGTLLAEAIQRYDSPPRLAGRSDLAANALTMDAARNAEVNQMAREWGVDPKDLEDQILAVKRGTTLPSLPLPAVYIEEAVARYKYPQGIRDMADLDSPDLIKARAQEIRTMAAEWGISEGDLWARVRSRLSFPEERSPMMTSFELALNLSTQSRDPERFPKYANVDGSPMGTGEADWTAWEAELAEAKSRYGTDYNKWPGYYRKLDDAKRRGEVARLQFLMDDPDYEEYAKWFGMGKDMTEDEWDRLRSGEIKRYRRGTVEEWDVWDEEIRLYEAAPRSSPVRAVLKGRVSQYNRLMDPGWRSALYEGRAEFLRAKEEGTEITERSRKVAEEYPEELFGFDPTNPEPWRRAKEAGVGSPLELQALELFESQGLYLEKQYAIELDGKPFTVPDFADPESKLAVYIDGGAVHGQAPIAERDKAIRNQLVQEGWNVVSVRAGDLNRGAALVDELKAHVGEKGFRMPWW